MLFKTKIITGELTFTLANKDTYQLSLGNDARVASAGCICKKLTP
jgi:hypothetical protein